MFPLPHGKVWQTFLLICGLLLIEEIKSEIRIVCYYTNWSIYRPGTAKFSPQNINPYLCTHLIYAFGGFTKDNALKPFDKYQDIEQGGYAKFTGLKSYNKNLKTLLAIGGWNEGSSRFSPLVANPERRHQLIKNILKFLRQNHFDGLDLDWEYPAFRDGGKPRDKENYAQFVEELRLEFDRESAKTGRPRLLLTMAVPAGIDYVEKGYDIPKLNKYLDWFNILTYDYHSAYEPSVNHHSPLKSLEEDNEYNYDSDLNIDYTIKYYLKAGADRDKLVLGIPTYGRSYTLVNEEDTSIGAPADGPGEQGDATREKGYLAYYEICQALRDDPEWKVIQPNPEAMGPYAYKNNQWVGYDDEEIVRRKAEYVVENRLGGIMFWSIDNDDFRGTCSGKPYPLIEIGKSVLLDRLGDEDNEVARPNKPRKTTQRSRARQGSTNRNKISENTFSEKTTAEPKKRVINQRRSTTRATTVSTTSISSLSVKGRTTTPEPPTTPDPGSDFKCEEEGFFAHPRDCKKYFWCLDSGPSNLGIVAHQFTCPSGLYFNTIADSCDFSRNVLCKKSQTTTKASNQIEKTSTTTTTSSPKITAATSRSTFLRHTTTTTTPEPEISDEEYEDEYEEEHNPISKDSEEDPKVIKELIELIKKVGGLEELEKQLHLQEDGSMILKNNAKQEISTTPSSISKSLYHKVLSRPNSLNSLRNRFGTSRAPVDSTKVIEDAKSDENDEKIENKYSSVIRNSRPSPQNAGIDKLPEFEGFLKERPKYVTINRTRTTQTVLTENDKYNNSPIDDHSDSDKDTKSTFSTQTPSYVNIRRSRPTKPNNAEGYANDATEGEPIISTSKFAYQSINRRRGTTQSSDIDDEQTTKPTNIYRYKSIERPKLLPQFNSDSSDGSPLSYQVEDSVTPSTTVQYLDLTQQNTKSHSIQKSDTTTRTYANIERRTTTTTAPDITTSSTMLEAAITLTPELTTSTKQSIITTTVVPPLLSSTSNTLQSSSIPYEDIVLSSTENIPNNNENSLKFSTFHNLITTGLDTEGYETTAMTDKNTDTTTHKMTYNNKDEVTLINKKKLETTELKFPGTTALYTNTKLNSSPKNTEKTDYSLSKTNVDIRNNQTYQDTIKNFDIEVDLVPTTPTVFDTSVSTTAKKNDYKPVSTVFTATNQPTKSNTDKDIQVTVSSPRPFGFPRKRTRPTFSNKILTTTSQTYVDTISDTTLSNLITKKTPQKSTPRPNSRRPAFSVRRRITTTPSSSLNNTAASSTKSTLLDTTSSSSLTTLSSTSGNVTSTNNNFNKYIRRTRPSSYNKRGSTATTTTIKNVNSQQSDKTIKNSTSIMNNDNSKSSNSSSINDIPKISQRHVIRRKFGRPTSAASNNNRRITSTISPDENVSPSTDQQRTSNPLFRRRHTLITTTSQPNNKKEFLTTIPPTFVDTTVMTSSIIDTLDQEAGSSIHDQKFTNNRYNQIGEKLEEELVDAIKTISRAPIPKIASTTEQYLHKTTLAENIQENLTNNRTGTLQTTTNRKQHPNKNVRADNNNKASSITTSTKSYHPITNRRKFTTTKSVEPFEKIKSREFSGRTFRPIIDYDYYDDEDIRLVSKSNSQVKVVLHGPGIIECLDQGNFPHPLSCRKFISCAKMETGGVVGWEYTCPKGLSYDPVGGICNWAAGLGCKE